MSEKRDAGQVGVRVSAGMLRVLEAEREKRREGGWRPTRATVARMLMEAGAKAAGYSVVVADPVEVAR